MLYLKNSIKHSLKTIRRVTLPKLYTRRRDCVLFHNEDIRTHFPHFKSVAVEYVAALVVFKVYTFLESIYDLFFKF